MEQEPQQEPPENPPRYPRYLGGYGAAPPAAVMRWVHHDADRGV